MISDLIRSIAANPGAHVANREEKMNKTIDVMCKNMSIKVKEHNKAHISNLDESRGYGKNRRMGD